MPGRSSETTLTFRRPFSLGATATDLPAGRYRVVTEETRIDGLTFQAFHRTATLLYLPALGMPQTMQQVLTVDPETLAAAQQADQLAETPAGGTAP